MIFSNASNIKTRESALIWKKIIEEVDSNNDGEVDLEELKQLMLGWNSKIHKKITNNSLNNYVDVKEC